MKLKTLIGHNATSEIPSQRISLCDLSGSFRMKEEIKSIAGYEGLYQISNFGYILNNKGKRITSRVQNAGYLLIHLNKEGKRKAFTIHRLVALNFIDNPECKMFVNHKDSNRLNNCSENLEWVTAGENMKHAFLNGRCEKTKELARERMRLLGIEKRFRPGREGIKIYRYDADFNLKEIHKSGRDIRNKYRCDSRTLTNVIAKRKIYKGNYFMLGRYIPAPNEQTKIFEL